MRGGDARATSQCRNIAMSCVAISKFKKKLLLHPWSRTMRPQSLIASIIADPSSVLPSNVAQICRQLVERHSLDTQTTLAFVVWKSRNKRKRQPIGMLGRSSGNHDWLLANASACVSCGFRLRNARNASDCVICVWMETGLYFRGVCNALTGVSGRLRLRSTQRGDLYVPATPQGPNLVRAVSELLRRKHGTLYRYISVHQPSAHSAEIVRSRLDSNPTCSSAPTHDFTFENCWGLN